jgi:hypothetical protein
MNNLCHIEKPNAEFSGALKEAGGKRSRIGHTNLMFEFCI